MYGILSSILLLTAIVSVYVVNGENNMITYGNPTTNLTLLNARIANIKIFMERTRSVEAMDRAFDADVTDEQVGHTITDVGDFKPKFYAKEYDGIITYLKPLLGYAPVIFDTSFDPSTMIWITPDYCRVDITQNHTTGYNATTQEYKFIEYGHRNSEYILFVPNSSLILQSTSVLDPASTKTTNAALSIITAYEICGLAFAACGGTFPGEPGPRTYMNLTGFTSFQDCVDLMNSKTTTPCPFTIRSDTSDCRNIHSVISLLDPANHCQHVSRDSIPCKNSCLPACSNCDVNADCVPIINIPYPGIDYKCQCKNGYTGNGTTCSPRQCPSNLCPDTLFGSYNCSNGICRCTESFTPSRNTSGPLCSCEFGEDRIFYRNHKPLCIPVGRCLDDKHYQCTTGNGGNQSSTQVKCTYYGNNDFSILNHCKCNFGFKGGWKFPCYCPTENSIVYSKSFQGEICLSPNQCTLDTSKSVCGNNEICSIVNTSLIGTCVSSTTKRSSYNKNSLVSGSKRLIH